MMLTAALLLALVQDPAGDAPPEPSVDAPAPIDPQDENDARPAPAPKPDTKAKPAPRLSDPPNKMLAAGVAAGATCLAAPTLWCCATSWLCAWIPCLLTPALAAGGATAGLLASGAGFEPVPIGAAAAVGAGGALLAAGIGVPAFIVVSGVATSQAPTNPAGASALNLGFLAAWTAAAAVLSLGTAAGVGAAVYFLMPDEAPAEAEGKGERKGGAGVEARARAHGENRFAMAF
jgi:hypothetical protein